MHPCVRLGGQIAIDSAPGAVVQSTLYGYRKMEQIELRGK